MIAKFVSGNCSAAWWVDSPIRNPFVTIRSEPSSASVERFGM